MSVAAAYLAEYGNEGPTGMNAGIFERYCLMRDVQQGTLHEKIRNIKLPLATRSIAGYLEDSSVSTAKKTVLAELYILARTAAVRAAAYAWAREELSRAQWVYTCLIDEIKEM